MYQSNGYRVNSLRRCKFSIAAGPVTGCRAIADWIETEGRVTRTFYKYEGEDRTYSEVYKNYLDAFEAESFEILGKGMAADRKGVDVGSRQWMEVTFRANPATKPGAVGTMFSGTSSSGGAGAIVASKKRAAGTAYVVVYVEQHSKNYIGTLIDIVEIKAAETGLVVVDGESKAALDAIAGYLKANPDKNFYVFGHT